MARIEDLEDVGYRVKYDDKGTVVGIVGNRGEPSPFVLATTNKLTGGIEESFGETTGLVVLHRRFSDFSPSILPSLVSGATYAQAGNTVTVTATAHGLPSNRNGFRIFWPGSAAVPAGWYGDFAYVDANTYTFTNPTSQTVSGGTALTAGLPYTTVTVVCSALLEAGLLTDQGQLHVKLFRSGSANVNSKFVKITDAAGVPINASLAVTASAMYCATISGYLINGGLVGGAFVGADNTAQTDANRGGVAFDRLVDNTVRMVMSNSAASSWVSLESLILEVVK